MRLQLRDTLNTIQRIYGLSELELLGHESAEFEPCELACENGGGCWTHRETVCTCVRSWYWRGATCGTDCTAVLSAAGDWCSNRKRAACYADDGLCGSCLDGFTLSGFGPGVSPDNLGCAPVVINACGDSDASNYHPLALPDDDTDCVYPEIVVESALEEQEEEAPPPDDQFKINVPAVVIVILVTLFVLAIGSFAYLHHKHSKRGQVHSVEGEGDDEEEEEYDEHEQQLEEARRVREEYLQEQEERKKGKGKPKARSMPGAVGGGDDPYAHLSKHRKAREARKDRGGRNVATARARAQEDLNASMSYPSAEEGRAAGGGGKGRPRPKGGKSPWVEYTDESSGAKYYHNEVTDETSWERPAGA